MRHYDFKKPVAIKEQKAKLAAAFYNECYYLSKNSDADAVLFDPVSHRKLVIRTSYLYILFYSGDYLDWPFKACEGICLEAQYCPDTPNQFNNVSTLLYPGKKYNQLISWAFSWGSTNIMN